MLIKTRGIVFRAIKYSETSLITDIYTEEKGLRTYIISGVRKKNARTHPSLLQLMTLVDMVAYHRDEKSMTRIKEIKAAKVYHSIPFDVTKGAIGMFMIEVSQKTILESEENAPLFYFFYEAFSFLDDTTFSPANIHLIFLLQLSAFLGFYPGGICDEQTPIFDLQEGVFVAHAPNHTWHLNESESQLLFHLLQAGFENCHTIKINRKERKNILRQLIIFYRLHLENFPEINAHQVLETVLS